jgi:membrane protein DedA with SNARE-associated domain
MHHYVEIWYGWVQHGGYWGIILLMAMESSIIPVPAEIVIPPAAFLAAQGHLSLAGVVVAGTFGSYIGSALSYWVSLLVGRPFIAAYGKYFLLGEAKIARAETWLVRYEAGGIFFARLLPVIRHLISIPAGILRMNFAVFSAMTILGAAIWCCVLAFLGRQAFQVEPGLFNDPVAMEHFIKHQSGAIIGGILILACLYFLVLRLTADKAPRG